jgi:hypothetical protein
MTDSGHGTVYGFALIPSRVLSVTAVSPLFRAISGTGELPYCEIAMVVVTSVGMALSVPIGAVGGTSL